MSESGLPGFQSQSWFGIVGPAGLPRSTITQLNRDVGKILATNDIKERFLRQGAVPAFGTPEEFKQLMQTDFAKYQKLVKDAGISAQ
jgi:tripartite-type tricarboxylate transporter receptor subunit TctC